MSRNAVFIKIFEIKRKISDEEKRNFLVIESERSVNEGVQQGFLVIHWDSFRFHQCFKADFVLGLLVETFGNLDKSLDVMLDHVCYLEITLIKDYFNPLRTKFISIEIPKF